MSSYTRDIRAEIVYLCEKLKDPDVRDFDIPFIEEEIKRLSKIQKNNERGKK